MESIIRNERGGKYLPNLFGFHDMHGNLWEWVDDYYFPTPVLLKLISYNQGGTNRVLLRPWLDTELFTKRKRYARPLHNI